ncbi:ubiquinol oxidase subunit II [bacterium]|nr:ubiquinol oxidase subunit II [bacterium]
MKTKIRVVLAILITAFVIGLTFNYISTHNLAVLNPKGVIAFEERKLLFITILLSALVVVPVFCLTIFISWKYRESNKKAKYSPHWDHDPKLEFAWWAIPVVIISILAVLTWQYSHSLDPFKPLQSNKQPLHVQVIALQWRWLFIYPDQHVAAVNTMPIQINRPINLHITSDAPMNSIWIPQLAGQIYAMSGMSTKLHLDARHPGVYKGVSANISGKGFAGMTFSVPATNNKEFNDWMKKAKKSNNVLTYEKYNELAKPSTNRQVILYSDVDNDLYNKVIMKYMQPSNGNNMTEMDMNHAR